MACGTHRAVQHRCAVPGIEAVTLTSDRAFPRHAHDHFGIGVIAFGAHRSWSGVGAVEASAGDVIMVNPGEIHDGRPVNEATRGWRMLYLDPGALQRDLAEDAPASFESVRPAASDSDLAALFAALFGRVTAVAPDLFAVEEAWLRCFLHVARGHGVHPPRRTGPPPCVARARAAIDACPQAPISLADLATLSGVSRFQLLRGFAQTVGATPHAYLVQRRVRLARRLLVEGLSLAEVATAAGFADQSHMTRAFVRQFGIPPGRCRAALA